MIFLKKETSIFEQIKTMVKSRPIPSAASSVFVVAKAGHVPKIDTKSGFSVRIPFKKFFLTLPFSLLIYLLQNSEAVAFASFTISLTSFAP